MQPAFAEREIYFEKTVNVPKELLLEVMTDYKNYPLIFSDNVKSVDFINENLLKINISVNGLPYDMDIRHSIDPDGKYVILVSDGGLQGTKMIASLMPTWGFDGSASGGTTVKIELTMETHFPISLLVDPISDDQIKSAVNDALDKFVYRAKSLSIESNPSASPQDSSTHSNQQIVQNQQLSQITEKPVLSKSTSSNSDNNLIRTFYHQVVSFVENSYAIFLHAFGRFLPIPAE